MSKVYKDESEWQKLLDDESYRVTRLAGTERPFSGKYWDFKESGSYKCICCGEHLLIPVQNMIQVVDGQVSLYLQMKNQ